MVVKRSERSLAGSKKCRHVWSICWRIGSSFEARSPAKIRALTLIHGDGACVRGGLITVDRQDPVVEIRELKAGQAR